MEILLFFLVCCFIGILCALAEEVLGKGFAWALWAVCGGIVFIVTIIFSPKAKADSYYRFTYSSGLVVGSAGTDYFDARSKASKVCFQALTGGKYPGEERGMDIITECANPVK